MYSSKLIGFFRYLSQQPCFTILPLVGELVLVVYVYVVSMDQEVKVILLLIIYEKRFDKQDKVSQELVNK